MTISRARSRRPLSPGLNPRVTISGDVSTRPVCLLIAMIGMIGGVSLVLEGGNAYAHQRIVQNGSDSMVEVWVMHTGLPPVALMTHTWYCRTAGW